MVLSTITTTTTTSLLLLSQFLITPSSALPLLQKRVIGGVRAAASVGYITGAIISAKQWQIALAIVGGTFSVVILGWIFILALFSFRQSRRQRKWKLITTTTTTTTPREVVRGTGFGREVGVRGALKVPERAFDARSSVVGDRRSGWSVGSVVKGQPRTRGE